MKASASVRSLWANRRRALAGQLSLRGRHLMFLDLVAAAMSFVFALGLRFDAPSPQFDLYFGAFAWLIPVLMLVRVVVFVLFSLYQRVWRYASVDELVAVVSGAIVSSVVVYGSLLALTLAGGLAQSYPRSIPLLDTLVFTVLAGVWRFSFRVFGISRRGATTLIDAERALVVGSGLAAIAIVRELRHGATSLPFAPVGVLADDLQRGQRLMGLPVLGSIENLAAVIKAERIRVVLLALPGADGRTLRRLVRIAEAESARCLTVPSFAEIAAGRVTIDALRQIDVEDLLRRAPARIDMVGVEATVRDQAVLITGAGGSIGSELARQILALKPGKLVLVGRGENSIFEALQTLPESTAEVVPVILDIRDSDRVRHLIGAVRPAVVFHAAAHKHVHLMELYPDEAASTNVFGTEELLRACSENGVERFVLISTDKAVRPTSVMGASKRAAELLVQRAAQDTQRPYVSVRFGNVLSSRGSVVPIFRRQLAQGGPLLVTDPEVTRFFMTIPEAVQLVLQAAAFARVADTFVLDMGEPVRIADLAKDLIALHGLELDQDIEIKYTGLKPGEKLAEELVFPYEHLEATEHGSILRVRNTVGGARTIADAELSRLRDAVRLGEPDRVVAALRALVPEFQPSTLHAERH